MRSLPRRLRRLAPVIALVASSIVGQPSRATHDLPLPGSFELNNLEHVYNFNPWDQDPFGYGYAGTDLEFFTQTVPLRDYRTGGFIDLAGNPVAEPVMAERDFAVMGSYSRGGYVFDITDPQNSRHVTKVACAQQQNDVNIKKFTDASGNTKVVLAMTQQSGKPCGTGLSGPALRVASPSSLSGHLAAQHWTGTPVDGPQAPLVYVGSGCTALSYTGIDVRGKIALADSRYGEDSADYCPAYFYKQKVDAAEINGAVGFVQIDTDDSPDAATTHTAGIPAMEIGYLDGTRLKDAVLAGETVEAQHTQVSSSGQTFGWGDGGVAFFDLTDPYRWTQMYRVLTTDAGAHNFTFHPTKPFGYVSTGALPGLLNEIPVIDFTDLARPQLYTGRIDTEGGVHDLDFSTDGLRAYVASENNYRILDVTNPANPQLVSRTPNGGTYAHGLFPTTDRGLMVSNNESLALGGFFGGAAVCPGEGLTSYAIAGDAEKQPQAMGYYVPDITGPVIDDRPCTSHVGRFAPDSRVMAIAWYAGGTRIVDWSDPANPEEVASAVMGGTNAWASKFYKGPYVYTGDMRRGFDVFRWTGGGPAPWLNG